MESIRLCIEAAEDKGDFEGSIVSRDESLAEYASIPGLGPPDLCWLQKHTKGAWSTAASEPRGYFHYCLGRDVSSSAAIAAYFADLNAKVDPISMMQGLWYSSEVQIQRGFYCTYDPFSRLDIRCELCIPGGVACGALDSDGTVHEVAPEMWRNCSVAAFLRHQLLDPELTANIKHLHRTPPVPNPDAEQRLLTAVFEMYATGVLPQALEYITSETAQGCVAEHMDLVLYTFYQYFGARHRWHVALEFFLKLQQVYHNAAVYVAAIQRELDSFDDSFTTLSATLEAHPHEPCLLLSLANECMYADQVDLAAKLARRAVRLNNKLRPAWLLLSRCYIRQGLYSLALITLNVMPPPPMPTSEQELIFGVPPVDAKYHTGPSVIRYDPDVAVAKQMATEEISADGSRSLLYLPAAIMVPREPLDLGPWPDLGPARTTRAVLSAAYGLLQELVAAIGWDSFLEMRARVFVMQSEAARRASGTEEQQQVQPLKRPLADTGIPGESIYNLALEELAAAGLNEHPDELHGARQANAIAAKAAQEDAAANGVATVPAAGKLEAVPVGQARAGAALYRQETGENVPLSTMAGKTVSVSVEADVGVELDDKVKSAPSPSRRAPNHTLAPVNNLPTVMSNIPGGASLWSIMFGAPQKSQGGRSDIDVQQMAKLQQYGSLKPSTVPGPVAEASASTGQPSQPMHVQEPNPWQSQTGPAPWQSQTGLTPSQPSGRRVAWWKSLVAKAGLKADGASAQRPKQWRRVIRHLALLVAQSRKAGPYMAPSNAKAGDELVMNMLWLAHAAQATSKPQPHRLPVCSVRHRQRRPFSGRTHSCVHTGPVGESREYSSDDNDDDDEDRDGEEYGNSTSRQRRSRRDHTGSAGHAPGSGTTPYVTGALSNVAADREFVLLGTAAVEEEQQSKAKRLCVRWLDELIIALWHDLQAYMEWKAVDAEMLERVGTSLVDIALGKTGKKSGSGASPPVDVEVGSALAPASQIPHAPPGDWMRRGLLAERLYHDSEALMAYRCCLAVGPFNLIAAHAVMRLAAEAGDTRLALQTCLQVLSWHSSNLTPTIAGAFPPTAAICCLGHVASVMEPEALTALLAQLISADEGAKVTDAVKVWLKLMTRSGSQSLSSRQSSVAA